MPVQIAYQISDRKEVERIPGLHVEIWLRRSEEGEEHRLEATVDLRDETTLGTIRTRSDELRLPEEARDRLVREACLAAWNDIMIDGAASAGIHYRDVAPWLLKHVSPAEAATLLSEVEKAFRPALCACEMPAHGSR